MPHRRDTIEPLIHVARMAWARWSRVFLGVLLVTAVAKGGAYLPGYSIDDYILALDETQIGTALKQGRFVQWALLQAMLALQIPPAHSRVLYVTVGILVSAALGALVVRWWGLRPSGTAFVAAAIIANHPYTAEIFTFRTAVGPALLPLGGFAALLLPRRWNPRLLAIGAGLFVLLVATYQLVLHYALMILIAGVLTRGAIVLGLRRRGSRGEGRAARHRREPWLRLHRLVPRRFVAVALCVALGLALYLVLNALVARFTGVQQIVTTLQPEQAGARLFEVGRILRFRFLEPNPMTGRLPVALQLGVLVAAVAGLAWRGITPPSARRLAVAGTALLALGCGLLWSLGVGPILHDFWPAPRTMSHTGVLWAAILVAATLTTPRFVGGAAAAAAGLLLLSYVGVNNRVLQDQHRLNQRDLAAATRMLEELEGSKEFAHVEKIALHGRRYTYPVTFPTTDMDLNISAFGARQAKSAILIEISGRPLSAESESPVAEEYCRGREPWPAPGSTAVVGRVAVVCLDAP